MTILEEIKSNFAIKQVAQGAPYFDILETWGLAIGYWNIEIGKGKFIIIFWEDKRIYPKKELKTSKALTSNMFVIIMFTTSIEIGF